MFFSQQTSELKLAEQQAREAVVKTGTEVKILSISNFMTFWEQLGYAFKFVFQEKEILVFAAMQWVVMI